MTKLIPDKTGVIIFGAMGDLSKRKLMPALFQLASEKLLPDQFYVLGSSRRTLNTEQFRLEIREALGEFFQHTVVSRDAWNWFEPRLHYCSSEPSEINTYRQLADEITRLDQLHQTNGNHLLYLATPPSHFIDIIHALGITGLSVPTSATSWTRIIIEKPFGHDLESARLLTRELHDVFKEEQVYRIDHYLGKETVQNILVFRFANGIFEPLWNQKYIDHVQITVAETLGVESRGAYYEEAGAIRDMLQNHMLQLLCLVAMEPPVGLTSDAIRDEKMKVLKVLHLPPSSEKDLPTIIRGQYGEGKMDKEIVAGYRNEPSVAASSVTETFVAVKLLLDNWRWSGVPFYLRCGKRLPKRTTEIAIQFKSAPHLLFQALSKEVMEPNLLVLRIQPEEGISLRFALKPPGTSVMIRPVDMDFKYAELFGTDPPEAYERLLLDAMHGDSTLFTRWDEVEAAWDLVTQILNIWRDEPPPSFPNHEPGTWGPEAAFKMIEADGRRWREP